MDPTRSNQTHEELIEGYLFRGFHPSNNETTSDSDQQFAKPIEDEDMFADLVSEEVPTTSSQIKRKRWVALKGLCKMPAPKKFAADCDEDGMVGIGEIEVVPEKTEPKSSAKEIFHKASLKRVKDKYGLYKGQKLYWDRYNDYLHRKISSDKRKRWDSLHTKLDKFDDEEELVSDWRREDDDKSDAEQPIDGSNLENAASLDQDELDSNQDSNDGDNLDQEESESNSDCDDEADSEHDELDSNPDRDDDANRDQKESESNSNCDDESGLDQEESEDEICRSDEANLKNQEESSGGSDGSDEAEFGEKRPDSDSDPSDIELEKEDEVL